LAQAQARQFAGRRTVEHGNSKGNMHVGIGKENYFLSADGLLMPSKKDQAPPDLRYFKETRR
jgi:hypothetical protein